MWKRTIEKTSPESDDDGSLRRPLLDGDGGNGETLATASFFAKLSFSWVGRLLCLGRSRALELDDVPELGDEYTVTGVFSALSRKLGGAAVETRDLSKALLLSVWRDIAQATAFALVCTTAQYAGPFLIDSFVQYLERRRSIGAEGFALVSFFLLAKAVECVSQRHWFFRTQVFGMRAQAALAAVIYRKGLKLSVSARQDGGGDVVNVMSVDSERVGEFSWYMIDLLLVPFQVGLALVVLYRSLQVASLVALAATVAVMAVNVPFARLEQGYQEKMMEAKDRRMKATAEALRNMRVLKLHAWETFFLGKILDLRESEAGWLKRYVYADVVVTVVYWAAPIFIAAVTFLACVLMGIPLESGKVLSTIATFGILKDPIYNLPETISLLAQTKISLDRISRFLSLEQRPLDNVDALPRNGSAVEISHGAFSWDPTAEKPTLDDVNLQIAQGAKVGVCGTVGCGKSSLIAAVLGEIPRVTGVVRVSGRRAFVAQSPWIQSGTIESNVLFGSEMDRDKYERVLDACALRKDLQGLPSGDQTRVGERGVNLSGGQKQRLQIARALYRDADVYLLDDPFSAVDAHIGTHLFKECLLGLLASKTVIFVTHRVEFLSAADVILVMREGRIIQRGSYTEVLVPGTNFMELVEAHAQSLSGLSHVEAPPAISSSSSFPSSPREEKGNLQEEMEERKREPKKEEEEEDEEEEEKRERGRVGLSVYWKYMTALYRGALVPLILVSQALFQVFQIGGNYWMATVAPVIKGTDRTVKPSTLILVYVFLSLASSAFVSIRALLLAVAGSKTATLLFRRMHQSIFRAPLFFFDSTPSSRILNRASVDQSAVDLSVPGHMGMSAAAVIQLAGIVAVMSLVAGQVIVVFIPVVIVCVWYQQYYMAAARDLTRLVGVLNAPIIHHFGETVSGLATIRCHEQESRFMAQDLRLINACLRPRLYGAGAMEWLCFRLDMASSLAFASSLGFLISMPVGLVDPGAAGLAVTYGLGLNTMLAWAVWNVCNLENKIISVERILQYSSIPSEPPLVIDESRPPILWPEHGEIRLYRLQVRYAAHLPMVLKGITCTLPGGTKTGIVGRTGSGKTTLVQSLFRAVDPAGGEIRIDGVDINTIGLHDLRSRLGIIPQDPALFEGTLRANVDPLGHYSDLQIWEAVDSCRLGDEVRRSEEKLETAVADKGENWSVGQRQLVNLARVLLKKSKILVLDEATSSVDAATDALIQTTVRRHFAKSTVITVAHRVATILDSDLVLLLDNGLVVEFGSPSELLDNRSSSFARLVEEYSARMA
ncbi:ABC transporter C family member 3-like [Wolffia australiana]